ncbi:hypothetical protein, conserved [Leishmania tarentolae]|uniref:Uncharacterized protein n=1 Tax=Leishmania tarentolae TaxID=5689 RepID=A0A640KFR2_LEITA|nr:hypothetical protein, conserved [Leishmania tarentolae]
MHSSVYQLTKAACHTSAKPDSTALVTAASSAAGKQAVEELEVYLRAMKTAQRRWAREIVAHETHVRRLMMVEEQCRERLKQQVLKGTREHLKYLTNTDLMAASQLVSPPSVDVFLAYGILPEQVSGFTVYVMGCLAADPNRLNVPLSILIADLSSRWAIVPPRKKEAYNELAAIFRLHLPSRAVDAEGKDARATEATIAVPNRKVGGKLKATRRNGASVDAGVRVRTCAPPSKPSAAATGESPVPRVVRSASKQLQARRRKTTASVNAPAPPLMCLSSPTAAATHPFPLLRSVKREQSAFKTAAGVDALAGNGAISSSQFRSVAPPPQRRGRLARSAADSAAVAALTEELPLPDAERDAFCRFAEATLHEMEMAVSLPLAPCNSGRRSGSFKSKRPTKMQPHRGQLLMKEWLPIAAEEWARKTRRQKSFYMRG